MMQIFATLMFLGCSTYGFARDPLQPGSAINTHGAIGTVVGNDLTAVLANPAGMNTRKNGFEGYVEMSPGFLSHSYTHPGFDPYILDVLAPPMAAGGGYSGSSWTIGALMVPQGLNTNVTLMGLPIDLTPSVATPSTVTAITTGYDAGLGGSFRLLGNKLSLGVSVLQSYRKNSLHIDVNGSQAPLLDANMDGFFHRFIVGGRATFSAVTLGLSIAPPAAQRYGGSGTAPALNITTPFDVETTDYKPLTIGTGASARFKQLSINLEYSHEAWKQGSQVAKTGLGPQDAKETNLKNTNNISLSGDYSLDLHSAIWSGGGYFPGNIGEGTFIGQGGVDNLGISGMRFGNFSGMDQFVIGGGFKSAVGRLSILIGTYWCWGSREVPKDHPGQGSYSFFMASATSGFQMSF